MSGEFRLGRGDNPDPGRLKYKEHQLQTWEEMGSGSDNCQRLKMTADGVNVNEGKELKQASATNVVKEGQKCEA